MEDPVLRLRQVKHLAQRLDVTVDELLDIADRADSLYEEYVLHDPARPDKIRVVVSAIGKLRDLQDKLLRRVLLPALHPSDHSHGGIAKRHIKTNIIPHIGSVFAMTSDISNFYPSIAYQRVERLFLNEFQCTPAVSRVCTRLVTRDYHLALGLPTSPILADQLFQPIDHRIAGACKSMGLIYTRFVDDISISGTYDLAPKKCGIARLIDQIIGQHGFKIQVSKHQFGRLSEGICFTKLRIHRGHIDVRKEYVTELERQLDDAASLARDGEFEGPYYFEGQIRGRINFILWINPGRRVLWNKFRYIDWQAVMQNGLARGYVQAKKRLIPAVLG